MAAKRGFQRALRLAPEQLAAHRGLERVSAFVSNDSSPGEPPPRLRIAILSLLFNWPSTGGGTVHTKELADALLGEGYDVRHIYAVYEPWGLGRVTEPLSVPTVPLDFHAWDWKAETIQDRYREAVDEFAPDAVIITDSWNTKPLLAEAVAGYPYFLRLAALETICPLNNVRLLCEDGCLVQCLRNQLAEPGACRSCVRRFEQSSGGLHQAERQLAGFFDDDYPDRLRRAYRGAEAVLAVNPTIAELVRPFCRRVEVVPSGFDPRRFPAPQEDRSDQDTARPTRFLFAGLVDEPMKGFPILFEACRRLWDVQCDFELVVTSEPRPEWDAPFVRWIGWQSQAALPQAISACELLVFPTLAQEALGRTVVEAMGCGNPLGQRISYDATDRRTVERKSDGSRTSMTYDAADQQIGMIQRNAAGTSIGRLTYAYDTAGNRTGRQELDGSRVTWSYDAQNQLLGENRTGTNAYRQTYTFDSAGNRTLKNIDGTRTTYSYDAANQLVYGAATGGRTTYTFDTAGNQQRELTPTGDRTTVTWNYENQPTLYQKPLGARVTCLYNADNRRVRQES